jgi:hypothetical protein
MAKKRPTPNEQARLHEKLIVPDVLDARGWQGNENIESVPIQQLVDHVLADNHPGNDTYEPQWQINFAHDVFSHQKMRARLSDHAPVPLVEIARECVHADDDEIRSWGGQAFRDFAWQMSPGECPLSVEQLSMVICLVGLTPHPASHLVDSDSPVPQRGV